MAGTSDKVTIEQGESVGLPDSDFDVVTVFNIEGWASDLFVLGPGHLQHPEETPSREAVKGQGRNVFLTWPPFWLK